MKDFIHSRLSLVLGFILVVWLVVIGTFQLLGMRETFVLQPASIQHDAGCAYVSAFNHRALGWPVTAFVSDSNSSPQASRLILLRNGQPFGQAHAMHDDIRKNGNGNYSHWGGTLYFSLPDCTNPRESEAQYTASVPISLTKSGKISWFVAAILLGLLVKGRFSGHPFVGRSKEFFQKSLNLLLFSPDFLRRVHGTAIVLLLLFIFVGGYFFWLWTSGRTISLAVGGAYQVSDAMAYWTCASALLDMGHFGNATSFTSEWCQRRTIYPHMLSGLAWIAQKNIYSTLLLQAVMVCLVILALVRRSSTYVGFAGVILVTVLLLRYATTDLFALTMTENAGLIFGCIGLASLLKSAETRSMGWAAAGIGMFSIALNARAGAFFILPFLVLWSGIFAYWLKRKIHVWLFVAVIAAIAGFVLQAMLVVAVGGNPSSSHGNFSYVVYGLASGGAGWQQVLIDHPELSGSDTLMSKTIYALAWDKIRLHPELLMQGLTKNLAQFATTGTYGFEKLGGWSHLIKLCWWFAWIPLLTNARKPAYLLIALSSLGIIVSTPFLLGDGGSRIFAATVPVDVVQIALGFHWAVSVIKYASTDGLFAALFRKSPDLPLSTKTLFSIEIGLVLFLLTLLVLPHGLAQKPVLPDLSKEAACKADEFKVVTFLGDRSSMLLNFVSDSNIQQAVRGNITKHKFAQGIPSSAWFHDQAIEFKGGALLSAYQLEKDDTNAPGPYLIISHKTLPNEYYGKLVLLCIDKRNQTIIFDTPYRQLNSMIVLD